MYLLALPYNGPIRVTYKQHSRTAYNCKTLQTVHPLALDGQAMRSVPPSRLKQLKTCAHVWSGAPAGPRAWPELTASVVCTHEIEAALLSAAAAAAAASAGTAAMVERFHVSIE